MKSNHIKDDLCIGVIDQGEKDYLLKCIHEGLVPLPRSASIQYALICFDENMQVVDYRLTTKAHHPRVEHTEVCIPKNDTNENMIVEGVPVAFDKNDTASQLLSPLNSDMTNKNVDRNELWYDFASIPPHAKHVVLAIDTSKFDEMSKYLIYLSNDTEEIFESFYIPDIKKIQPSGYHILCTFEKNEDVWIIYRNDIVSEEDADCEKSNEIMDHTTTEMDIK